MNRQRDPNATTRQAYVLMAERPGLDLQTAFRAVRAMEDGETGPLPAPPGATPPAQDPPPASSLAFDLAEEVRELRALLEERPAPTVPAPPPAPPAPLRTAPEPVRMAEWGSDEIAREVKARLRQSGQSERDYQAVAAITREIGAEIGQARQQAEVQAFAERPRMSGDDAHQRTLALMSERGQRTEPTSPGYRTRYLDTYHEVTRGKVVER